MYELILLTIHIINLLLKMNYIEKKFLLLFLRKKYEFQNFDLVTLHISAADFYPPRTLKQNLPIVNKYFGGNQMRQ